MTMAGLRRYGDWRHVTTGCNVLVYLNQLLPLTLSAQLYVGNVSYCSYSIIVCNVTEGAVHCGAVRCGAMLHRWLFCVVLHVVNVC